MFRVNITLLAVITATSLGSATAQTKVYDPSVTFSTGTTPVFGIHVDDVKKTVSVVDRDFITLAEKPRPHRLTRSTWLRSNGTKVRSFTKEIPFYVLSVSYSADGKWIIAGGGDFKSASVTKITSATTGRITILDAASGQFVHEWTFPGCVIWACRTSPNRGRIAGIALRRVPDADSWQYHVQMIDSRTGQLKRESPESTGFPFGMCFSSNGKQVHICHSVFSYGVDDKSSRSFVSSFGKRRLRIAHKQKLKDLLPTGPATLCAIKNGWVATRKGMASSAGNPISTGHISARGRRNQGIIWSFLDVGSSAACDARNGLVVYNNIAPINVRGFGYNHIAVRSATTGELIYQLRGQKTPITGLALANGGRQVVSGDDKGTIRVWDLPPASGKGESSSVPQP